jgi:catechol 2,3-dioxygenase-like lactoylglutathione lyase family enzyme
MKVLFISSFSVITPDSAASVPLYQDTIGLPLAPPEGTDDEYVFSDAVEGCKHFGVWPLSQAAQACFGTPEWPADVPVPQASLEFDVEDVSAAIAELRSAGYRVLHEARTEPWGQEIARILSPEGIVLGVSTTPWMRQQA